MKCEAIPLISKNLLKALLKNSTILVQLPKVGVMPVVILTSLVFTVMANTKTR